MHNADEINITRTFGADVFNYLMKLNGLVNRDININQTYSERLTKCC